MMLHYSNADPNQKNKDGTSTYGMLFYHCLNPYFEREGFKPNKNMRLMMQKRPASIDIHKPCVNILQNNFISTPIYSYFLRRHEKIILKNDKIWIDEEDKKQFFGDYYLEFSQNIEYFEFLSLFFNPTL